MLQQLADVPMRNDAARPLTIPGARPAMDASAMHASNQSDPRWAAEKSNDGRSGFHASDVAHIATTWKGVVANLETDDCRAKRYATFMLDVWVKSAIEFGDISQAELSRRLTAKLGRSIDRAAVNKLLNGRRALAADEMIATAEMTGYPIPVEDMAGLRKLPKLSFVSAGRLEPSRSISANEIEGWVTASDLPAGDWFALTVSGDSMNRAAPHGSTILVNRSDTDLRDGAFYVFAVEDGDGVTFKRYFSDPERLEPYSYTPDQPTIYLDQPARVVGRVRMALAHLDEIVYFAGHGRK